MRLDTLVTNAFRHLPKPSTPLAEHSLTPTVTQVHEIGVKSNKGNLISLQPVLTLADFSSKEKFVATMITHLSSLQSQGFLNERSVVALPELIGTGFINMHLGLKADDSIHSSSTLIRGLIHTPKLPLLNELIHTGTRGDPKYKILRCLSKKIAADYQEVFSTLANEFNCHILAGSIILPSPAIIAGKLEVNHGRDLYNVACLFLPSGRIHSSLTRKVFLTDAETELKPGKVEMLPVYNTPIGRIGVLLCADAWFPQSYSHYKNKVDHLIISMYQRSWEETRHEPWSGYSGHPNPGDVENKDINNTEFTQEKSLKKYLFGRVEKLQKVSAVVTSYRGHLFDAHDQDTLVGGKLPGKALELANDKKDAVVVWLK